MKRLLIGDGREALLSTLEVVLKHWGYRVTVSSSPEQLKAFLEKTNPDLLIMGAGMLTEKDSPLYGAVQERIESGAGILIVLRESGVEPNLGIAHETIDVPINIFGLFETVQKHLEKYPRKNLRLTVKLPSLFSTGETASLAEVMSISTQGLFVKTSARMQKGDQVKVVIPLLGMKKELEVSGRVLYRVLPGPENNYLQGAGIEFTDLNDEVLKALQEFIEKRFLGELAEGGHGDQLNQEQLRK